MVRGNPDYFLGYFSSSHVQIILLNVSAFEVLRIQVVIFIILVKSDRDCKVAIRFPLLDSFLDSFERNFFIRVKIVTLDAIIIAKLFFLISRS